MWSFSTRGGTWTRTPQRAQDFKSGVSTNSTTRAFVLKRTVEVERETGFEPATPTLARLCSTNWATLAYFNVTTFVYVAGDKFINILWYFSREWHNISHKLAIIWAYNWLFLFDLWHNQLLNKSSTTKLIFGSPKHGLNYHNVIEKKLEQLL